MAGKGLNISRVLVASMHYYLGGLILLISGGATMGIRTMGFSTGAWMMIAVGILIILMGIYQGLFKKYLFEEGVRAEARVTDIIENFNFRFQGRPALDVHYIFTTDHDEEIEGFSRTWDYDAVKRANTSGFVTVAYDPSSPEKHMVLNFYCN
ncbi:MAG: hypothetical protein CVV64_15945 [Candidatus Wallbacteria bacterium HGW-Wallbacteria-1]|uniref:DUF3592 domain-containing protein n=1 Tax=Candidatus Wallbacteria bacterium HGW-Wallbacteria-1 TaxID=2013854 RepID=A0A2N1PL93_9BACT|nr:MAG: hypothetical protein CVV64_15945 [Candidatus Wallbacteria bacterium HGW-Wallbacteria-1]